MNLTGKVAIVTGGTSGIGRAAAIAYAQQGAKVVVAGRRVAEGEETVRMIKAVRGDAIFVQTDVTQASAVKATIDRAVSTFGRIDIAFNNAGVFGESASLLDQTDDEYDRMMNANVKSVWLCMKYEIAQMIEQGNGAFASGGTTCIVNTASILATIAMPNIPLYVASKHAVVGLTKATALQYAKSGIRVNAVSPGAIATEMIEQATGGQDEAKAYMAGLHPIGRLGKPEEIANAVLWLSSDAASFVTGETLMVDGGFVAQ
ncbi:SDR family oxidoreductase [Chamaesiphon minutus]|uniref:SDR family oxidoreductase n=1 Tax=Chamaesiphon minutus TaxID=1173032 RepID=UPI0012F93DF5|nr:SDR family oxidoreductase [Chamaesiphon minutus]